MKAARIEVYPAFLIGSEGEGPNYGGRKAPGWVPWMINPAGRPLLGVLGSGFYHYIVFIEDNPEYDWTEFDFGTEPDNLEFIRAVLEATNPDLSAFKAGKGKLLGFRVGGH